MSCKDLRNKIGISTQSEKYLNSTWVITFPLTTKQTFQKFLLLWGSTIHTWIKSRCIQIITMWSNRFFMEILTWKCSLSHGKSGKLIQLGQGTLQRIYRYYFIFNSIIFFIYNLNPLFKNYMSLPHFRERFYYKDTTLFGYNIFSSYFNIELIQIYRTALQPVMCYYVRGVVQLQLKLVLFLYCLISNVTAFSDY